MSNDRVELVNIQAPKLGTIPSKHPRVNPDHHREKRKATHLSGRKSRKTHRGLKERGQTGVRSKTREKKGIQWDTYRGEKQNEQHNTCIRIIFKGPISEGKTTRRPIELHSNN